jgi:RNA recognition motif-containing protein
MSPSKSVVTTAQLNIPNTPEFQESIVFGIVDSSFSKSELKEYFSQFGSIRNVNLEFNPLTQQFQGLGFVTAANEQTFKNIMAANHIFKGTNLNMEAIRPEGEQAVMKLDEGLRARVDNIPVDMTKGEFSKLIEGAFKGVKKVNFVTKPVSLLSQGHAFLYFADRESLNQCLQVATLFLKFRGEALKLSMKSSRNVEVNIQDTFSAMKNKFNPYMLPGTCKPPA